MLSSVGHSIAKYRKKTGLSQKELAERLGITPTYMSLIEKGKKWPSHILLKKVCSELNIEEHDLYKDLFLESLGNKKLSEPQKEIVHLLRILIDKVAQIK
ncbi:helix-turn-helix transcriptional regulator [Runella zeae]|uniref:helix-turn-helix transcriptional regulator n=1 Tax=Runella zeae TaxID=94255 RepID=UPI000567B3B6|nr:helix-turn-helix transcriptional regulator [Runella zeae]